jgi:enamine deaminase RidA (YjgF/YER057c/UK114 family)
MQNRTAIVPQEMKNISERFHYSPAVKAGPFLFVAGQVGRDEHLQVVEGKEAQFVQAFENVKKVLAAAGASFDDVVDMVSYHVDMRDLQLFIEVRDRYVTNRDRYPAWTAIGVAALAMPGLFAEIECTALLPA